MTRLAGITTVYALIAALLLVTPLSASEDPEPQPAAPEAASPEGVPPETASLDTPPQGAAPPEPTPQNGAPRPGAAAPGDAREAAAPGVAGEAAAPGVAGEAAAPGVAGEAVAPAQPAPAAAPAAEATAPAPAADDRATPASADSKPRRSGPAPRAKAAADTSVTIRDFEFAPATITIDAGDTVTWTNDGPTPHSATADDGSFDTGIRDQGESGSHTFDQAGTFSYFCTPHPSMRGTVTVRAASTGGGSDGDGSGEAGGTTGGESGTAGTDSGSSADSSGAALPATGLDSGGLAVLGLVTLGLGAWLRRRAAAAG
jgi:LPXTG-motif cell wall-anchored protein